MRNDPNSPSYNPGYPGKQAWRPNIERKLVSAIRWLMWIGAIFMASRGFNEINKHDWSLGLFYAIFGTVGLIALMPPSIRKIWDKI